MLTSMFFLDFLLIASLFSNCDSSLSKMPDPSVGFDNFIEPSLNWISLIRKDLVLQSFKLNLKSAFKPEINIAESCGVVFSTRMSLMLTVASGKFLKRLICVAPTDIEESLIKGKSSSIFRSFDSRKAWVQKMRVATRMMAATIIQNRSLNVPFDTFFNTLVLYTSCPSSNSVFK